MSNETVLVTGGAGFIGSHVVELLLQQGMSVRVLDSLVEQVHQGLGPRYVPSDAEFVRGDVRDRETLAKALRKVDQCRPSSRRGRRRPVDVSGVPVRRWQ